MFCVRLMQHDLSSDPLNVENLLETRINAAIQLRNNLGLPSSTTNAFRLVNSEGLIVDVFGDLAVVASSAAWVEKYKEYILKCISQFDLIKNVVWRPSIEILKEEGLDLALPDQDLSTSTNQTVKIVENGISYIISLDGQKTGFYADQRENRQFLSTISDGQRVLDMCCYTGGFALNAARGHALEVTGVDSSSPALELANQNIALNNLDPGRISFLKQDATAFMK
nr:ribosomal RNA large subunit methyltransferase I-like isoform X2 [Tanacetum cinerariifolium]